MCTLIVASRMWEGEPLVVAANRDEELERPCAPPGLWTGRRQALFAPKDLTAGGTWLGLNALGLFCGITNRFGTVPPDPHRRSRGLLVLDALEEKDAQAAAQRVFGMPPTQHNRFHLVLADRERIFLVWSDGERLTRQELGPGLQVFTERSLGAAAAVREEWIAAGMRPFAEKPPTDEDLADLLRHHADDPFEGTCVHAPALGYGTRSSSIIRLGSRLDQVHFLHAEGPPCRAGYRDLSAEALALFG